MREGEDEGARVEADVVLVSVGASPRTLPDAQPDGERILTWKQVYDLTELPEHLIVVGSGVTGAEFANAYDALGAHVTLVSSRDRVLPGEDADAAEVLEGVFRRRGMDVMSRSRAQKVERHGDRVVVTLADGRTVEGSHCIVAVGAVPNTAGSAWRRPASGRRTRGTSTSTRSRARRRGGLRGRGLHGRLPAGLRRGHAGPDRHVARARRHRRPAEAALVASTVFTSPEIATVGWTQAQIDSGEAQGEIIKLPLSTNARAKMLGIHDGFVKLFCRTGSGTVIGGVVVAPRASELIFPVTLAVEKRLNVDDVAHAFTIYPSLSGSIAEAARQLHVMGE